MLRLNGKFNIIADVVRGDKSLAHRALIFASVATGQSVVSNLPLSEDVLATVDCLRVLGADIRLDGNCATVTPISTPNTNVTLNCRNSGTTARLLAGLVAGLNVNARFVGDSSLSARPMLRVIEPLRKLGANIRQTEGGLFEALGGQLRGATLKAEVNSAQVKSAVLIAGLFAEGKTTYVEQLPTRNHTELMLASMGAEIEVDDTVITVAKSKLKPLVTELPRDVSSTAFLIAAALLAGRQITCANVLLNDRRTGFLRVLTASGAKVSFSNVRTVLGEQVGDITAQKRGLKPLFANTSDVCDSIDELPVLASIALTTAGKHVFENVCELRHKESDRVQALLKMAQACGQKARFDGANLTIESNGKLPKNPRFESFNDHRIAMAAAVLCLVSGGGSVDGAPFEVSFPEFYSAVGVYVCKLGLIGSSIVNSCSPLLMQHLATVADVNCSYDLVTLSDNATDKNLAAVINDYDGLNVTMPFKTRVASLTNSNCVSVNTVGKRISPQSTDGYGLIKALQDMRVDFENKPLLIVGAGGAATLCVETLLQYGCKIKVINRTQSRADELTKKYNLQTEMDAPYGVLSFVPECEFEQNLTLPDSCRFVFVAAYKGQSGLRKQAIERGITYVDGLRMLYHQGAKSFALWTDTPVQDDYNAFERFLNEYTF